MEDVAKMFNTDKKMKLFEDETELPSVDELAVCICQ